MTLPQGYGHHWPTASDGRHQRFTARDQSRIREKVEMFDAFTADNNPHGERDFGSIEHNGEKVFWKIDYYDRSLQYGSEDPAARNLPRAC